MVGIVVHGADLGVAAVVAELQQQGGEVVGELGVVDARRQQHVAHRHVGEERR